jgi:hypothetical protein
VPVRLLHLIMNRVFGWLVLLSRPWSAGHPPWTGTRVTERGAQCPVVGLGAGGTGGGLGSLEVKTPGSRSTVVSPHAK